MFINQGRLNDGGLSGNKNYDFQFSIWDAETNGHLIAGPMLNLSLPVSNGLFTTEIDFGGDAFDGGGRWLEIGVRTNGNANFTILSPRQKIATVPYAIYSESVNAAGINNHAG